MILSKKKSAFLLSETIVSLLILVLTLSIINFLISSYRSNQQIYFRNDSEWEVAMLRLENLTSQATLKRYNGQTVEFVSGPNYKYPNKKYRLEIYHDMLRVKGSLSGHMPLILHQEQLNFKVNGKTLHIKAVDQFQRKWEYYLDFQ